MYQVRSWSSPCYIWASLSPSLCFCSVWQEGSCRPEVPLPHMRRKRAMSLEELAAAAGLVGVILYGVLGGADFGGGVWDLFAGGPRRDEQRAAIAHAMGPVWQANHVWLIFVIVLLFTAFPPAFAALTVRLFVVFHFVLVGITLRGPAFVFRGAELAQSQAIPWR